MLLLFEYKKYITLNRTTVIHSCELVHCSVTRDLFFGLDIHNGNTCYTMTITLLKDAIYFKENCLNVI